MLDFIAIFAVLIHNKINFVSLIMSGDRYPIPDDSVSICKVAAEVEPYEFVDISGVMNMRGEIIWQDIE